MYNFHKVKGQKHCHEFRHPFFIKDAVANFVYIRRKHVNKDSRKDFSASNDKVVSCSSAIMASKLLKMEEILQLMSKQNQNLKRINCDMMEELRSLQASWDLKVKDLIGLTFNFIQRPKSELGDKCRQFLIDLHSTCPALFKCGSGNISLDKHGSCEGPLSQNLNTLSIIDDLHAIYKSFQPDNDSPDNETHNLLSINLQIDHDGKDRNYLENLSSMESPMPNYDFIHSFDGNLMNQNIVSHNISPLIVGDQCKSPYSYFSNKDMYKTLDDIHFDIAMDESLIDKCLTDRRICDEKWNS